MPAPGKNDASKDDQKAKGGQDVDTELERDDQDEGADGDGQGEEFVYETWLSEQPDNVKDAIAANTTRLSNALKDERTERKNLERQIKELRSKAEKGSDLEKQLSAISADLDSANERADFAEEAVKRSVKNVRLAYKAAKEDGLIDDRGRINWEQLEADYPELFQPAQQERKQVPRGNAGAGAGQQGSRQFDMNTWIREQAGIRSRQGDS